MTDKVLVLGGFGAPPKLPEEGGGGGGGGGGEAVLIDKTISANGTYRAVNDNADGYKKVTVNVSPKLQSKEVEVTSNGVTTVYPDSGKDGLSSVEISTDVSPILQSKSVTISANGSQTVSPDAGKDGLSSVTITTAVNPPLQSKEVTVISNGYTTVMPPSGAYGLSAVLVTTEVPNTYAAADEGKVVSGGVLVAQTSDTFTANGTYDTTLKNSVTVNVQGSSGYTLDDVAGGAAVADGNVTLETATAIKDYAFAGWSGIVTVHAKKVTTLAGYAFRGCGIQCFVGEKRITSGNFNVFSAASLRSADIDGSFSFSNGYFTNNANFNLLILRRTGAITSCASTGAFNGTAFSSSGAGGTIYAPSALIATYKGATNWSTIDGWGKTTWKSIEGSIYETKYVDGTTIPT